ncbi:LysM peptidoglycan-binding domain-containing C40 family peptidase, partial [bacterium]|nr:LysM peptidoglycan-binding domain-containing C40 family peptidase [bacterium]
MRLSKFIVTLAFAFCVASGFTTQADVLYSVREKDTIDKVAAKYNVTAEQILKVNPKVKPSELKAGMILVIPDSPDDVAMTPDEAEELLSLEEAPTLNLVNLELNRAGDRHRNKLSSRGGMGLNSRLIRSACQYMGTPYMMGGTGNGVFDCSGFTMRMYQKYGVNLPRTADVQFNVGTKVRFGEEKPGDLVFFETYLPGPSHVGIYMGNGQFIHASSSRGVTISSLNQPY